MPADRTTERVFEDANRALLILGEPGAGKTVELLLLAQALLERAGQSLAAAPAETGVAAVAGAGARGAESRPMPIPVLLYLSSWADDRAKAARPLADWIAAEVKRLYGIRADLGAAWLASGRLLPLLDGLDEVPAPQRAACAEAIDAFYAEHRAGLVVTCRESEYRQLPRLTLIDAIRLLPLECGDIERFLNRDRAGLAGLRGALRQDAELAKMAASPLLLGLMADTYRGRPAETIVGELGDGWAGPEAEAPLGQAPETRAQTDRRAALFDAYLDHAFRRKSYLGPRPYSESDTRRWLARLAWELERRGRTLFLLEELQPDWAGRWVMALMGYAVAFGFYVLWGIAGGCALALQVGTWATLGGAMVLFGKAGSVVAVTGALWGLSSFEPAERLSWSWAKLRRDWMAALALLFIGVPLSAGLGGLVAGREGMASGAVLGLILGLLFGVLLGGRTTTATDRRDRPNQGMRTSALNGLRLGLLGAPLMLGAVSLMVLVLPDDRPFGVWPSWQVVPALIIGGLFLGFFLFGGRPVLQHTALRLALQVQRRLPLNLVRFCDHAVALILLQRAGGVWLFIHRDLQRHLAARFRPPS